MTSAEFSAFRYRAIRQYAAERASAGDWAATHAEDQAAQKLDSLLPEGLGTPGVLLLAAVAPDGASPGMVWIALDQPLPGDAWIYFIEVDTAYRGKGYGRALLRAAEEESARHGAKAIGLNVFAGNTIAQNLYKSSGYQITAMHMRKELGQ